MSTHETNTWRKAISQILTRLGWFDPPIALVGLTSRNSFGMGSTLWTWEPRPKFRHTNKINILSCCSNFKILLNLSLWVCLKKFGSKKFFEPPTGGAPRQKKFTFFARQLRNSKFAINPFTNI